MAAEKPVFETWKGEDGKIYAHIQAANGRITWTTEGYSSDAKAEDAIFTLIGWVVAGYYEVRTRDELPATADN